AQTPAARPWSQGALPGREPLPPGRPQKPGCWPGPSAGCPAAGPKSALRLGPRAAGQPSARPAASSAQPPRPRSPAPDAAVTAAGTGRGGPGGEVARRARGARGARGGAPSAGGWAGSAHGVWGDLPGAGLRRTRARGPRESFPAEAPELRCQQVREGRRGSGEHACVWVSPSSTVSEHVLVGSVGARSPHQPPGLTGKIARWSCLVSLGCRGRAKRARWLQCGSGAGPSQWHKLYPIAQGDRQSPINIVSSQAVYSPSLKPLELSYEACISLSITNNGHSVQVDFNDSDDRTAVTGGPLDGPYRLKQLHFHWGKKHSVGSEHTVDGKSFPSELHLVHWNAKKYSTFGEAASAPDGLAVVGIFLETGDEHPSMNRLTDALYMVRFKGTKAQFSCFNPKCLLPASRHYWTYPGSLTTPPLSESVTWIVLREPISISERQMEKFRSLLFTSEEDERIHMVNNFRPPQPLKGRVVKASFRA
uniref:Carbonic anhydrase n=1 Tax=Canis lupus familiaris TaxID=9615 RepID=A0A8P0NQS1_CANLF